MTRGDTPMHCWGGGRLALVLALGMAAAIVVRAAPAPADPTPTARLVDGSTGQWHVSDMSGAVKTFYFGNPGDFPIVGD